MRAITSGDRTALATLVERYHGPLRTYFVRLLAWDQAAVDDLVQETLLRVLKQRSYSPQRPFRPWLYAIATNVARDHWRREATVSGPSAVPFESHAEGLADERPGPQQQAEADDELRRLTRALALLPEEYRLTLALRYLGDLSLAEIAGVLEVPLGTVKSRLSTGARRLHAVLVEMGSEVKT